MEYVEYKINEFISLKLEEGKTFIYLSDEIFLQCIQLVLAITYKNSELYDKIGSIDEASELCNQKNSSEEVLDQNYTITPEEEFRGHCSNIQAWAENNYDTRLLHSNLSFPLLKELYELGDPIAKKVFREELIDRLTSDYPVVVEFLVNEGYLVEYFSAVEATELLNIISIKHKNLKINYIQILSDLGVII